MEQESMLSALPMNHETVLGIWEKAKDPWDSEPENFTWKEVRDGVSYFIYGRKMMALTSANVLKIPGSVYGELYGVTVKNPAAFMAVKSLDEVSAGKLAEILQKRKRQIFRKLVGEVFACCNDLPECTEKGCCSHPGERMYNGCVYRERMEKEWDS